MTFRHVWVSLAAVTLVAACSSDESIVSLNVSATDRVPEVEKLQVTFTQGSRKLVREFAPPNETPKPPEGEEPHTSIKNSFFQRLTLPDDWSESETKLSVEAFDADGNAFDPPLVDETTVKVLQNEAVVAYVNLDIPEEMPPTGGEGGAGGAGGEGAGGADTGTGGASDNAGGAGGAGPSPGANGGEPAAAGGAGGAGGEDATGGVGGAG